MLTHRRGTFVWWQRLPSILLSIYTRFRCVSTKIYPQQTFLRETTFFPSTYALNYFHIDLQQFCPERKVVFPWGNVPAIGQNHRTAQNDRTVFGWFTMGLRMVYGGFWVGLAVVCNGQGDTASPPRGPLLNQLPGHENLEQESCNGHRL